VAIGKISIDTTHRAVIAELLVGIVGRVASEQIILQLIKRKC